MAKTIWKFPLRIDDSQVIDAPEGAQPLTVQLQDGDPMLWALVDPEQPRVPLRILMRGTGHNADGLGAYLGTFQFRDGPIGGLVFHAFAEPLPYPNPGVYRG